MNPFSEDKILGHVDRIVTWLETGTCSPVTLDFHMTNRCNHNCPRCNGYNDINPTAELSYEEASGIVGQFRELGIRGVIFSGGGEPLCNATTLQVIESIGDFPIGLITNGSLMDSDAADRLARQCTWIRVSLDAGTEQTYRTMHGSLANWDVTLANLEYAAHIKDRRAAIGVSYLTGDTSVADAEKAVRLMKELGLDYIELKPLRGSTVDFAEQIVLLREKYGDDKFSICCQPGTYGDMAGKRNYSLCHGQHFIAVVTANGDMYRCCEEPIKRADEPFGNVLASPVADVWYSAEHKRQAGIDVKTCPRFCDLCRNHGKNIILQNLFAKKRLHAEFV